MIKRIGIVTGTRAEFGLLSRIISLLQKDKRFDTRIFVCGAHLSPEFGSTVSEIEQNGVTNIVPIEMLLSSSTRTGIAKSVGLATISFSDAFSREDLDTIIVLGDRYEILAAAQAAMFLDIPLAHIHGGEVTEGAFDDAIRHSITKMANIHFPATKEFAKRIYQLGESPKSVFIVGSPGIDNIFNTQRMNRDELELSLGLNLDDKIALVTYHPVTKTSNGSENDIRHLVAAIKNNPQLTYVVTYPNADGGGGDIIEQWESISHLENVKIVPSLGFRRYLSLMEWVVCVLGNSSSGIIEAPSFHVGTVNIGTRQHGRPRASSIIDVDMRENEISAAIDTCCSNEFRLNAKEAENPYGQGGTAERVVNLLAELDLASFQIKKFMDHDIDE